MRIFNRRISIALNMLQYLYHHQGQGAVTIEKMSQVMHEDFMFCQQIARDLRIHGYITVRKGPGGGSYITPMTEYTDLGTFLEMMGQGIGPRSVSSVNFASEAAQTILEVTAAGTALKDLFTYGEKETTNNCGAV